MTELRHTPMGRAIENYLINAGLNIPTSTPDAIKSACQFWKNKKEESYFNDILSDIIKIDSSSLNFEKSLERIYLPLQVIAKVTTKEKMDRFKKLTINGIIYQNEISDNDYELYLNILDNLTDKEFIILSIINKIYPTILINENIDKYCGYKDKITLANLEDIINKFKDDTQISITEATLLEILKEATGLQKEINNYMLILYSKGLIELNPTLGGGMSLEKISILGQKFMDFINKPA